MQDADLRVLVALGGCDRPTTPAGAHNCTCHRVTESHRGQAVTRAIVNVFAGGRGRGRTGKAIDRYREAWEFAYTKAVLTRAR